MTANKRVRISFKGRELLFMGTEPCCSSCAVLINSDNAVGGVDLACGREGQKGGRRATELLRACGSQVGCVARNKKVHLKGLWCPEYYILISN